MRMSQVLSLIHIYRFRPAGRGLSKPLRKWMNEAGHAVAGFYCKHHPRVHEITIIPRGQAGGYTMYLPEKDRS